jgi:hypothetical protein
VIIESRADFYTSYRAMIRRIFDSFEKQTTRKPLDLSKRHHLRRLRVPREPLKSREGPWLTIGAVTVIPRGCFHMLAAGVAVDEACHKSIRIVTDHDENCP